MVTPATLERRRFADELITVGPDSPTLCGGWTTRDLAAHIVLRDRRPDAMPGVLVKAMAGYTDKVQHRIATREWADIVADVRDGAPLWSLSVVAAAQLLAARKIAPIDLVESHLARIAEVDGRVHSFIHVAAERARTAARRAGELAAARRRRGRTRSNHRASQLLYPR